MRTIFQISLAQIQNFSFNFKLSSLVDNVFLKWNSRFYKDKVDSFQLVEEVLKSDESEAENKTVCNLLSCIHRIQFSFFCNIKAGRCQRKSCSVSKRKYTIISSKNKHSTIHNKRIKK